MAKSESYDRRIYIWINGKEVKNDIASIKGEMFKLENSLARTIRGTKEYNEKAAELRKIKSILAEHRSNITDTGTAWDKLKKSASGGMGIITAGIAGIVGAYQSIKGIIFSTDALGDKFEATLSGWKSGLDAVARSIATMDFKNFGKNIKEAIEEGRRYAETQDALGDKLRALKFREAEVSSELIKQRAIENSVLNTKEERITAGKKAIALEEELEKTRTSIAKERYDNELKNASVITGESEATVEAYLRMDAALMEQIETGKKYLELQQKIRDLRAQQETSRINGVAQIDNSGLIEATLNEIKALDPFARSYAEMFANLGKLVDEKKDIIIQAYADMKQAETSGLENTLKIRTKTDNLINQGNQRDEDAAEKKRKADEDAAAEEARMWEVSRQIDEDIAAKEKQDQEEQQKRDQEAAEEERRMWEVSHEIDMEIAQKELEDAQAIADEKKKIDEEIYANKQSLMSGLIGLESTLFDRQFAKLEEQYEKEIAAAGDNADAKARIDAEYNKKKSALARKAAIAEKIAALFTIALDTAKGATNAASKIVTLPLVPWIIANGAVQAAIVAARPVPQFATGGFTGSGGKYEPAGIVHKGEYVVNADMVASPLIGPIIQGLEQMRVNGMPGYANGGGQGMNGSAPVSPIISSDPELKSTLKLVASLLTTLKVNGVKTHFDYKAIDNVRQGISKLDDIESDVSR